MLHLIANGTNHPQKYAPLFEMIVAYFCFILAGISYQHDILKLIDLYLVVDFDGGGMVAS